MSYSSRALRTLAEVRLGRQRTPKDADGPHMVPYLRAANVKDGRLDLSDVKTMNFTPEEQKIFQLAEGDVLITEGAGSLIAVGASAVWDGSLHGPICFQNTLLRLRPRPGTSGRFLGWWARHAYASSQFAVASTGANIYHLGAETVRGLNVPAPPIDQQRRIADFLDAETSRIDALITAKRRMSDQLVKARVEVIFAGVVGELTSEASRVPTALAWAQSLPDSWMPNLHS